MTGLGPAEGEVVFRRVHVTYYSVAEMEITDRSWVPEYVKNVTRMVEQRGGRFLARHVERGKDRRRAKGAAGFFDH